MAERMSYYLLKSPDGQAKELIDAIGDAKTKAKQCSRCFNLSEEDPCPVCADDRRDGSLLCILETPQDLLAFSNVKDYNGLYFVLGGALDPLEAIGPNDLKIYDLIKRLKNDNITEVILATDTDSRGESTALYIAEQIKPLGIKVTRLGYGLPVGGDLEYADEMTLSRALEGRREM